MKKHDIVREDSGFVCANCLAHIEDGDTAAMNAECPGEPIDAAGCEVAAASDASYPGLDRQMARFADESGFEGNDFESMPDASSEPHTAPSSFGLTHCPHCDGVALHQPENCPERPCPTCGAKYAHICLPKVLSMLKDSPEFEGLVTELVEERVEEKLGGLTSAIDGLRKTWDAADKDRRAQGDLLLVIKAMLEATPTLEQKIDGLLKNPSLEAFVGEAVNTLMPDHLKPVAGKVGWMKDTLDLLSKDSTELTAKMARLERRLEQAMPDGPART